MLYIKASLSLLLAASLTLGLGACSDDDDPSPAPVVTNTFGLTSNNRLVTFNRAAPVIQTARAITGLQTSENLVGFDIRPSGTPAGQIVGLGSTGRLYSINAATGAATLLSTLAADPVDTSNPFTVLSGTNFGVDFNPVVDRLRVVSDNGQDLRINVDTGLVTTDGALNVGGVAKTGITAAAYTNDFAAACRTALFYIDSATATLFTTTDPNAGTLTSVGALGSGVSGGVDGFEIVTGADGVNTAFAVLSSASATTLSRVDLASGAATAVAAVSGLAVGETLRGLAVAPPAATPVQALGELLGITETSKLLSFNSAAPQKLCTGPAAITGLATGETLHGADLRPANGNIVALGSSGALYILNPATNAVTALSTLSADTVNDPTPDFTALNGAAFGVDFNPVVDRLRVVSNTGQNLRINVETGKVITDGAINGAGAGATAAAYTNSFGSAGTSGGTTLFVIDPATDTLSTQNPPNNGTLVTVGALGVDATSADFEINGRTGAALAALTVGAATVSDLFTVNLLSGAATRVNAIGGGERVRGITFAANPQVSIFGVTTANRLISFTAQAPNTLTLDVPVSGLAGGENIVGIDVRPVTGELAAVTDANRLYRLDLVTGAASAATPLVAASGDGFTGLSPGTRFGVDFNPVPDRLRVVNSGEQNLRINPVNGQVTTDTALTPVGDVFAAAYTNNFAGATATTLFGIDFTSDMLVLQGSPGGAPNSPNGGVITNVGALGLNVSGIGGFDIAGGNDGMVLAALQTVGTGSELYRINLSTGAATPVVATPGGSGIGMLGVTPAVIGLAVRIR